MCVYLLHSNTGIRWYWQDWSIWRAPNSAENKEIKFWRFTSHSLLCTSFDLQTLHTMNIIRVVSCIYTYIYGSSKCCPRRAACCFPFHLRFFPAAPEVPVNTLQEATQLTVQNTKWKNQEINWMESSMQLSVTSPEWPTCLAKTRGRTIQSQRSRRSACQNGKPWKMELSIRRLEKKCHVKYIWIWFK